VCYSARSLFGIVHLLAGLEIGKHGSLIAVDGDPLRSIAVLQDKGKIRLVLKDGVVFKEGAGEGPQPPA
jgi:imidazolonepropionase-like amidohydrolase